MSTDYDFRFPGLAPIDLKDKGNALRVKAVRNTILKIANGFTEIPPGVCTDLIPGEGLGYIVSLDSKEQLEHLAKSLQRLAEGWGMTEPIFHEATLGPRRKFSFFLIPELANPAEPGGFRRPLFKESRWAKIAAAVGEKDEARVEYAYGEWMPSRPGKPVHDESRMFVVSGASAAVRKRLESIIRANVFDGGTDCDQACIYLSCGGRSILVHER